LADAVNTIGHMPLVDHHTYTQKVRVPTKQPQGFDEEQGLAITQCQEPYPQSPREVASILTTLAFLRLTWLWYHFLSYPISMPKSSTHRMYDP
jgi:hypothetical protein